MINKLKIYTLVAFLCSTVMLFAQPGATSDDAPEQGGMEGSDNQAPIGDYLWVLAVVVLVYAFFKIRAMLKSSIQG